MKHLSGGPPRRSSSHLEIIMGVKKLNLLGYIDDDQSPARKRITGEMDAKLEVHGVKKRRYASIPLSECVPNNWNPNRVPPELMRKLQLGIEEMLDKVGFIPPILVRPWKGQFQI